MPVARCRVTVLERFALEQRIAAHLNLKPVSAHILYELTSLGSMTPARLCLELRTPSTEHDLAVGSLLYLLELDRQVILHRDSTHDQRMGGLPLPDGSACTLVTIRRAT